MNQAFTFEIAVFSALKSLEDMTRINSSSLGCEVPSTTAARNDTKLKPRFSKLTWRSFKSAEATIYIYIQILILWLCMSYLLVLTKKKYLFKKLDPSLVSIDHL